MPRARHWPIRGRSYNHSPRSSCAGKGRHRTYNIIIKYEMGQECIETETVFPHCSQHTIKSAHHQLFFPTGIAQETLLAEVTKVPWKTPTRSSFHTRAAPPVRPKTSISSPRREPGQPKSALKGDDADAEGVRLLLGKPGSSRARDAVCPKSHVQGQAQADTHTKVLSD